MEKNLIIWLESFNSLAYICVRHEPIVSKKNGKANKTAAAQKKAFCSSSSEAVMNI